MLNKTIGIGASENILDSEVGLVLKTKQAEKSMGKPDGVRTTIKAGTLWTNPDEPTDIGIVFEDFDITDNDKMPISVMVQGRAKADKVAAEAKAKKEDFSKQGLYLV